jgi:hypothetical protein
MILISFTSLQPIIVCQYSSIMPTSSSVFQMTAFQGNWFPFKTLYAFLFRQIKRIRAKEFNLCRFFIDNSLPIVYCNMRIRNRINYIGTVVKKYYEHKTVKCRSRHWMGCVSSTAGKGYVLNLFWLGCSQLLRHAAFVSCVFVLSCVQCIAPLKGGGSTLWLWLLSGKKINHVEEIER